MLHGLTTSQNCNKWTALLLFLFLKLYSSSPSSPAIRLFHIDRPMNVQAWLCGSFTDHTWMKLQFALLLNAKYLFQSFLVSRWVTVHRWLDHTQPLLYPRGAEYRSLRKGHVKSSVMFKGSQVYLLQEHIDMAPFKYKPPKFRDICLLMKLLCWTLSLF
jgi:hypothetical protein